MSSDELEIWAVRKDGKWRCSCGGWSDSFSDAEGMLDLIKAEVISSLHDAEIVNITAEIKRQVLKEVRERLSDIPVIDTDSPIDVKGCAIECIKEMEAKL